MSVDKKISQLASGAPAQAGDEYVVARSGANYKLTLTNIAASMPPIGATTPNTGSFTSLTNSGNLTFSSTGQRITGDFSNATASNRLLFQTSTTNGNSFVGNMPNGTGSFGAYVAYNGSDPANSSSLLQGITSTDARLVSTFSGTGSFLPMTFYTGGSERMRLDTSGNVGIGGTADAYAKTQIKGTLPTSSAISIGFSSVGTIPSGSTGGAYLFHTTAGTAAASFTCPDLYHYFAYQGSFGAGSAVTRQYGFYADAALTGATNNYGFYSNIASAANRWNFYANGTAANYFAGAIGVAVNPTGYSNYKLIAQNNGASAALFISDTAAQQTTFIWNQATSGNNVFAQFGTDGGAAVRGSIDYDRAGGLARYNTTSDYRAKDVYGAWDDAGATIDALKVYCGKMRGATLERPMMIAHEAQAVVPYAVSGEKDAVDKDGNAVYQQMDHSVLVPLLIAELQAVRARLAALEAK